MGTKVRQSIHFSKKNDGQEVDLEFRFLAGREFTSVEKIRVELWVKQYATNMLTSFKVVFPDIAGRSGN